MATKLTGLSPEQVQDYARLEQEHASKSKAIGKFKEVGKRHVSSFPRDVSV